VPLLLLLVWQAHYVHRTLIYPFQMRVGATSTMPAAVVAMGFVFNMANSYVNATWISTFGVYPETWLADPRFVVGVLVFAAGYVVNRQSDSILRALRKPGETGYKIPTGGLYRWVSCPNYLGELLTWVGWTIATWSLAGLSFVVFTAANLVPRALANHRWYGKQFDEYPAERRAVIPYLV
jgi:steroid 5-alpha reductase family enzyme